MADIINAIPGAGHVDSITLPIGFPPPQLTVAEFRDTLQEIMRRCPPFNSMERILQYLSNLAIGRHACVAIRCDSISTALASILDSRAPPGTSTRCLGSSMHFRRCCFGRTEAARNQSPTIRLKIVQRRRLRTTKT